MTILGLFAAMTPFGLLIWVLSLREPPRGDFNKAPTRSTPTYRHLQIARLGFSAPPPYTPVVVDLARSLVGGESCGFALHDALLDSGRPDVADALKRDAFRRDSMAVRSILNPPT